MNQQDTIIEYTRFESSIEASLAKSKLDAYGVPCFLADENLANLYPIQNLRFSVRLHIFEEDLERVREILNERVTVHADEATHCPRCQSANVEIDYTKKFSARFLTILFSLLFTILPLKKVYRCNDCQFEFE